MIKWILIISFLGSSLVSAQPKPVPKPNPVPSPSATTPQFKRVIIFVLENENQERVNKNPYFKTLASKGATFTNLHGEIHPSQGNYIAMVAGDTYGIESDKNIDLNVPHLGDLLEAKQKSWHVYAENYPGNCFLSASSSLYVRKHLPFLSFVNVSKNPSRCANITNEKNFFADWKAGTLPEVTMYIPNMDNNGHDTNIAYSANWLQTKFQANFDDAQSMKDTLVVMTYDEDEGSSNNLIYTVLLGSMVKPGSVNSELHSHYSILKLIEDNFGLGSLNRNDAKAGAITGIWK